MAKVRIVKRKDSALPETKTMIKTLRLTPRQFKYVDDARELTGMTFSAMVEMALDDFLEKHIILCDACESPVLYLDKQIRGSVKIKCKNCGFTHIVEVE